MKFALTPEQRARWFGRKAERCEKLLQAIAARVDSLAVPESKGTEIDLYEQKIYVQDVKDLLSMVEGVMILASERIHKYEQIAAMTKELLSHDRLEDLMEELDIDVCTTWHEE